MVVGHAVTGNVLQVYAVAYDNPIPGYGTKTVGNLRLFDCQPMSEFKLASFNEGKYSEVKLPSQHHPLPKEPSHQVKHVKLRSSLADPKSSKQIT